MAVRRPMGVWVLAALLCAAPVACLFTAETGGSVGPCKNDPSLCDDGNPCTRDTCDSDGFCSKEEDNTLVPDDSNPCTEDVCSGGSAENTPVLDGVKCGFMDQLQCTGGKCNCTMAAECGTDTACTKYACMDQACQENQEPDGTFVDQAGLEDCRKNVCDGAGKIKNVPDVLDFPGDATPGDCQKKGCSSAGDLINVPEVSDVPTNDVPGDCKKKTCTPDGSPTEIPDVADVPSDTTFGDCKKPVCSPDGNVTTEDAPDDAIAEDGNPCTQEGCNGGMVISGNEPDDTSCGAPASCGPNGSEFSEVIAETCQSGVCEGGQPNSCGLYVCNGDACHVSCTTSAQCTGGAFCQGGLCKPQIGFGMVCTMDTECSSQQCTDGVCCNVACDGVCQSCAIAGQLGVCGSVAIGTPDAQCGSGELCNGAGLCKKENGETCAADGECLTGQCEDSVCCNAACGGDCKRCDLPGNVGSCENVPSGQTSGACAGGSVCNGNNQCKKINGETCGGGGDCLSNICVDEGGGVKVCCNMTCSVDCKSCLGSKNGGANGTCTNIPAGTDPNNDCTGSKNCNGMGACEM
jgi:hypothetical protein